MNLNLIQKVLFDRATNSYLVTNVEPRFFSYSIKPRVATHSEKVKQKKLLDDTCIMCVKN